MRHLWRVMVALLLLVRAHPMSKLRGSRILFELCEIQNSGFQQCFGGYQDLGVSGRLLKHPDNNEGANVASVKCPSWRQKSGAGIACWNGRRVE